MPDFPHEYVAAGGIMNEYMLYEIGIITFSVEVSAPSALVKNYSTDAYRSPEVLSDSDLLRVLCSFVH